MARCPQQEKQGDAGLSSPSVALRQGEHNIAMVFTGIRHFRH